MASSSLVFLCALLVTAAAGLRVYDVLKAEGYSYEIYQPTTLDGFQVELVRVKGRTGMSGANVPKPVVLLQHGLIDDCATWVVNQRDQSLGFILTDAGYDVFLGNVRGNSYTVVNTNYTDSSDEYWRLIDFDYMASQDLPTMINEALRVSRAKSLTYIGHSQGTLMGFAGFSAQPDLAAKVNLFIALAPVAYVGNQEVPLFKFLAAIDAANILEYFGARAFIPPGWLTNVITSVSCGVVPEICESVLGYFMGSDPQNLNATRLPYILSLEPGGTSVQNMAHWSQIVNSGGLQYYDFKNQEENLRHYGYPTPPNYPLHKLGKSNNAPPLALFVGNKDLLADPEDVKLLTETLPSDGKPVFVSTTPTYDHLDFVWGVNAHKLIYPDVLRLLRKYNH